MRVLVTRPAEDAGRTADALAAAGHEAVLAPLFRIAPLAHAPPDGADAIAATSANALRCARLDAAHLSLPLYAVGAATAAEARRLGFRDISAADGDSAELAALIAAGNGARIAWLAGRPRRETALLGLGPRFAVETIETYQTVAEAAMPAEAADGLRRGTIDAVLHFSPRAAEVFEALAESEELVSHAARVLHVFISSAAERALGPERKIAARPNLAAMIAALSLPEQAGPDRG